MNRGTTKLGAGGVLLAGAGGHGERAGPGGPRAVVAVHGGRDGPAAGGVHADGAGVGGDEPANERDAELGGEQRGGELHVLPGHDAGR